MEYPIINILSLSISVIILIVFFTMANNIRKILALLKEETREARERRKIADEAILNKQAFSITQKETSTEQSSVNDPANFDKMLKKYSANE